MTTYEVIKKKKRNLTSRSKARLREMYPNTWKDYYTFITVNQFKKLIKKPCYICGAKLKISLERADNTFTVDHSVRLIDGGKHEIDNLRACCHKCNQEKN